MTAKRIKPAPPESAPGLSRDMIVGAARDLARKYGFAKVSMRVLGSRLGVSAPAVYYYFRNKKELFAAVAAAIFEELAAVDVHAHWTQQLRAFVLAYQHGLLEYPGLARVILAERASRGGLLWTETILSILRRGGFRGDAIWPAFGMLVFFINPMTLIDEKPRAGANRQALFEAKLAKRAIEQSPQAYPMLAALLRQTNGANAPLTYDALLPIVLDSIIDQLRHLCKTGDA